MQPEFSLSLLFSIFDCFLCLILSQSISALLSRNISLPNASCDGLWPCVWRYELLIAYATGKRYSSNGSSSSGSIGVFLRSNTQIPSPKTWWKRLRIEFAYRFHGRLFFGVNPMLLDSSKNTPLNSLPLSIPIFLGWGYYANQTESRICCTRKEVGAPYNWQNSCHPTTGSTMLRMRTSYVYPFTFLIFFGPQRSTLTLNNLVISPFFSGSKPYFFLFVVFKS